MFEELQNELNHKIDPERAIAVSTTKRKYYLTL